MNSETLGETEDKFRLGADVMNGVTAIPRSQTGIAAPLEEALQENGKHFRLAFNHAPIAIAFVGADFCFLKVNNTFCRLFGYAEEELQSLTLVDLMHPEDAGKGVELSQQLVRGEIPGFKLERRYLTRKGETMWGEVTVTVVCDSDEPSLLGMVTIENITERKRAEAALRESEDRYRDLVENSGLIIGTHDLEGNILSVNQSFVRVAGYVRAEELIGLPISDLLAPGVRHFFPAYLEKIRRTGHAHGLMRIVTPGGEVKTLEYDNSVRLEGLTAPIVRCFAHDVTEHKRAEAAFRESEAQLRTLGDNLPNGVIFQIMREPDGRAYYQYISAGIERLMGVTAEEAKKDFYVLHNMLAVEEDRPRRQAAIDKSIRSLSTFDIEVRSRTRQGQMKWIRIRSTPRRLPNGGILWDGVMVDVTDTKRDLEAILQTVGAIIWEGEEDLTAQAFRFTFVSQQAVALLGYPVKDWLEQPSFWPDHLHPEDRQRVLALRRQAIAAKSDYELEYRMMANDGRTVWLRGIVKVVAENDQRLKLRGITVDITESKHDEAALRESEELFRTLAETTTAAIYIVRENRCVYANSTAEARSGYTRDELLAMDVWDLVHPEVRERAHERFQTLHKEGLVPLHYETKGLTKSGQERWVEVSVTPITFQGQPSRLVTTFDVTERKRTETALRESEARNRATLNAIPDLMFLTSKDGVFLDFHATDSGALFVSPEQFLGKNIREVLPPDVAEALTRCFEQAARSSEPVILEYSLPVGGGNGYYEARLVSCDSDRVLSIVRDITERKRADEQLFNIARGVSAATGENFFRSLVEHLARALGADYAFAGELLDDRKGRIRTIAVWADGRAVENFEYDLLDTPCANVVGRTLCSYPSGVQQVFPRDHLLAEMGVESYVGTPLFDSAGRPLGLMVVLCRRPLGNCAHAESMLQIFAARASAEMERKQTEGSLQKSHQQIQDLAGRLIVAQEEERKYIARELHDDLNQQVAALAIGISRLKRQLPEADPVVHEQIAKLREKTDWLSEQIRRLSHELHSSTLQHVGLAAALKSYCAEFAEREGIAVKLNLQDGLEAIPADAALCLYRAAQESLRNIARHSGAQSAEVKLTGGRGILELCVVDHGVGFDPKQAGSRRGLGLVGMEERVRLLHGNFQLKTRPGSGTEVKVQIPFRSKHE